MASTLKKKRVGELEPGNYIVTAKIRQTITVEEGAPMTEMEVVDEAINSACADLVDWDVEPTK